MFRSCRVAVMVAWFYEVVMRIPSGNPPAVEWVIRSFCKSL